MSREERTDILVVDDEPEIRSLLKDVLSDDFHCETARDGRRALDLVGRRRFDVILSDIVMPRMNGLELLDRIRTVQPEAKVILMTGVHSGQAARQALRHGAFDYIEKPFELAELKQVIGEALAEDSGLAAKRHPEDHPAGEAPVRESEAWIDRLQSQLGQACKESIMALLAAVDAKDPFTERHSQRVSLYAGELAEKVRIPPGRIKALKTAALLHDLGKIGVPDAILTKPGKLTAREYALIMKHPEMGVRILSRAGFLKEALPLILHHHERWDGGGYPGGLTGESIPIGSRILYLADAIDAMLSRRSYKPAMTIHEMIDELQANSGTQFDPRLTGVAVDWVRSNRRLLVGDHGSSVSPILRAGPGLSLPARTFS